jgi:NAD(P)-dependent dehydrogenase (short-subunit alcohol dehydrogenase family)
MELQGISALVTGGASGLGAATAEVLAGLGARVAILDVNGSAAEKAASAYGGLALAADVTSEESVAAAFAAAGAAHGVPRIVINCAGIGTAGRIVGRDGPMALSAFERVIKINLIGTFNVLRLAAAAMSALDPLEDGERGVIVNTASVAAFEGQIGQAAYAASKGGIVAMTLPAAREFARFGVRVNVVAPGIFLTPLLDTLPEEAQKVLAADIPFPARLGKPSEFADAVLFAVRNRYLNGEVIRLDGAIRMKAK